MSTTEEVLECLDSHDGKCRGEVRMRLRASDWKSFPRCEFHWGKRMAREEEIVRRYNPDGCCAPVGFDPADAGERWDDDY
jgi:hypothetical protein